MLDGICIVAHDSFMYFLGVVARRGADIAPRDGHRYNFPQTKWDKIAELQGEARKWAWGAAAHRQIPIADGVNLQSHLYSIMCKPCEVYK